MLAGATTFPSKTTHGQRTWIWTRLFLSHFFTRLMFWQHRNVCDEDVILEKEKNKNKGYFPAYSIIVTACERHVVVVVCQWNDRSWFTAPPHPFFSPTTRSNTTTPRSTCSSTPPSKTWSPLSYPRWRHRWLPYRRFRLFTIWLTFSRALLDGKCCRYSLTWFSSFSSRWLGLLPILKSHWFLVWLTFFFFFFLWNKNRKTFWQISVSMYV